MPNSKIFCSAPWYELQIYWDGGLGFCCQEAHRIYPESAAQTYNVKNMSIQQWMDEQPMRQVRQSMFGDQPLSICKRCYIDETLGPTSRRHKSNQKSVIFTRTAFDKSFEQSTGHQKFQYSLKNQGASPHMPIDLHIDLGNYCNLSCKMCKPEASSQIASQYVKWGIESAQRFVGTDWTRDQAVWERVLMELASIPKLNNIHFMGGETLITERFEDFLDFMIAHGRTDLNLSFVTNGTIYKPQLIEKLQLFQRIGIEVSIESLDATNSYQRQGTDQQKLMENLRSYVAICDGSKISLTIRPAISLLTIGSYPGLLDFCLANKFVVKNLLVTKPDYLDARNLPMPVKKLYSQRFYNLKDKWNLQEENTARDYNESDPNEVHTIVKKEIDLCLEILSQSQSSDVEERWRNMVHWCQRWDKIYGLDARQIYPELQATLEKYGYDV